VHRKTKSQKYGSITVKFTMYNNNSCGSIFPQYFYSYVLATYTSANDMLAHWFAFSHCSYIPFHLTQNKGHNKKKDAYLLETTTKLYSFSGCGRLIQSH
jgi:hypothetical protein